MNPTLLHPFHSTRFSILWSLLVTYFVGTLFHICTSLSDPFGFNLYDIKLNRLCATIAYNLLVKHAATPILRHELIDPDHSTPTWLEDNDPGNCVERRPPPMSFKSTIKSLKERPVTRFVFIGMVLFLLWSTVVILLTWFLKAPDNSPDDPTNYNRWNVYIPVASDTLSYVSLGVFLVLGFWLQQSYGRYWLGLRNWQTGIRPKIDELAFRLSIICKHGYWHPRDRERIFSYLVALPFVAKAQLRDSRDLSELERILSSKDLLAIEQAHNMPSHICDVLDAYIHHIDATTCNSASSLKTTFGAACISLTQDVDQIEMDIVACEVLKKFPISVAFTSHIQYFTAFWLALLPPTLVGFHAWVSFFYLAPIGYTIIKLLGLGVEMSNPFRENFDDAPLDQFCCDIKSSILNIYQQTRNGPGQFLRLSEYSRQSFEPSPRKKVKGAPAETQVIDQDETDPTLTGTIRYVISLAPKVSTFGILLVIVWSVVATFVSWVLSKSYKADHCVKWCSPVDLKPEILSKIGVALFVLLSFRAYEGLKRYEVGARLFYDIRVHLRSLAVEVSQSFPDGHLHLYDKERIVAHIVQIPLSFRTMLLGSSWAKRGLEESLLSPADLQLMENSSDPVDRLLKTVEAYFITADMPDKNEPYKITDSTVDKAVTVTVTTRIASLRQLMAKVLTIKSFPVVGSYTRHQRLMIVVWLIVLPFAMTNETGFFTILWAPLISYGILGLEAIANSLMDPFGPKPTDVRVDRQLTDAADAVIEAVNSIAWDVDYHVRQSLVDEEPRLGAKLHGESVVDEYTLARFDGDDADLIEFAGPRAPYMKQKFYAHLTRSVPVWNVLFALGWTSFACVVSYISRRRDFDDKIMWWRSFVSVSPDVGIYVSLGSFTVLGFFVRAAFLRYNGAGSIWGDFLRGSCHTIASTFMSYWPANEVHVGDKKRILGHLAAIPVALKCDLRGSRDLRELRGLLSSSDVARILYAQTMSTHCVTVVRSYFYKVMARRESIESSKVQGGRLNLQTISEMLLLERTVQTALFLHDVPIAPGFVNLLNTLLVIFFAILPFVLAELCGWFTILWVAPIAYGLLGVYAVAREIQDPFGNDLNDLDLDAMTDEIVADVVSVYKMQPNGYKSLVREVEAPVEVNRGTVEQGRLKLWSLYYEQEGKSFRERFYRSLHYALRAVPLWVLVAIPLWTGSVTTIAYFARSILPDRVDGDCSKLWFCSPIAIPPEVMRFIGFGLFILLGFRLNDSHRRYTDAQMLWKDGILINVRNIITRICGSYEQIWHAGDRERIAGHLCAFAVCLMGQLKSAVFRERLSELLGEEDLQDVLRSPEPTDHCLDVVRSYVLNAEVILKTSDSNVGNSVEIPRLLNHIRSLALSARSCMSLVIVPLPFGYVEHIRILLAVWLLILPLNLVEKTGWVSALWTTIIAYGMVGVERWSTRLADPFGDDEIGLPLEKLCDRVVAVTKICVGVFSDGLDLFIHRDRNPFSQETTEKHCSITLVHPPK